MAFDLKAPTFRHKMFDAYKGTRKPMPEELHEQVPLMKEVLTAMGVPILTKEGYEADDILGTIAKREQKDGYEVTILSGDRDLYSFPIPISGSVFRRQAVEPQKYTTITRRT